MAQHMAPLLQQDALHKPFDHLMHHGPSASKRTRPTVHGRSFRERMAGQHAIALPILPPPNRSGSDAISENALRRKTPSGIVAGGYNASSGNTGLYYAQPSKHLLLHTGQSESRLAAAEVSPSDKLRAIDKSRTFRNMDATSRSPQLSRNNSGYQGHASTTSLASLQNRIVRASDSSHISGLHTSTLALPIPPFVQHNLQDSQASVPHSSHIHEPPMNLLNDHINELTLHDLSYPSSNIPPIFPCNPHPSCSNERAWKSHDNPNNHASSQNLSAHGTFIPNGTDRRTAVFAPSSNATPSTSYADVGYFGAQSIPRRTSFTTISPGMSYPDHVLNRAHALYRMISSSANMLGRKSSGSDVGNTSSNCNHVYPQPTRGPPGARRSLPDMTRHWNGTLAQSQSYPHFMPGIEHQSNSHVKSPVHASSRVPFVDQRQWNSNSNPHPNNFVPPVDSLGYHYHNSNSYAPHHTAFPQRPSPDFTNASDLANAAWPTYLELTQLCRESGDRWSDGMLLAGCLAFTMGHSSDASQWFSKIVSLEHCHVALSNLALTALTCKSFQEAELYWQNALKLNPSYFEAAEHLVWLLCSQRRHKSAVEVIDQICHSFQGRHGKLTAHAPFTAGPARPTLSYGHLHEADASRLLGLIHAKGNILYGLQEYAAAAKSFEQAVLLALGLENASLADLVQLILLRLTQFAIPGSKESYPHPLLLGPDEALQTANMCFGPHTGLKSLISINDRQTRKLALSTTSNSLLSLAKIFQDGLGSSSVSYQNLSVDFGVREILALYYLSLSLQPSPSTANNVGILLASVPGVFQQGRAYQDALRMSAVLPNVPVGSGVALALQYYHYGLRLDSKHAHLYTNLGSLLKDFGQLNEAIRMYESAVVCDPAFDIALANLANAVKDQGRVDDAIIYYKRAVKANPNFIEAVCGLANALNSICNWNGRGGAYIDSGLIDRWHVTETGLISDARQTRKGSGWVQNVLDFVNKQLVDGESWGTGALSLNQVARTIQHVIVDEEDGYLHRAYSWSGRTSQGAMAIRLLERTIRRTGWLWYQDKYVKGKEMPMKAYGRPPFPKHLSTPSSPTVLPFHTFTLPLTARQIRLICQRNGLRVSYQTLRSAWLPDTVLPPPAPPNPHLNVGYVSSDFNNHPLAHLMQNVFGMHDTTRVKAFCYATTPSDNSMHRKKIEEEAPVFFDASSWSTERLVRRILQDGIHILINLNGYTRGARNEVFAARPAPIQMSFMGFAGSLGAEWCDYLLADETTIPPTSLRPYRRNVDLEDLLLDENHNSEDESWMYGENIMYTRDPFFCCDHRQSGPGADAPKISWPAEQSRRWAMRKELFPQLPINAIIFANFNQLYKIDPTTFRTWLRILDKVENSILWLLKFPASGVDHLRHFATLWASKSIADRIYFTDVAPKHVHIARGCVADLFLDTPECNAHTTAADCLWSGTPILTLPRYEWKMCSRMAAGILAGALPRETAEGREAWEELVVGSEEEYEETAVRLARGLQYDNEAGTERGQGKGRLMDLRKMIWEHRWTCPLFDTRRWVYDLEVGYHEAWRRWVEGEGGDIWLKDLL